MTTPNPFADQGNVFAAPAAQPAAQAPAAANANVFAAPAQTQAAPAGYAPAPVPAPAAQPAQAAPPEHAPAAGVTTMKRDPFSDPAGPGSGDRITDLVGELLLIKPLDISRQIKTTIGEADAVRADVGILSGARAGEVSRGMLVFQRALFRDLEQSLNDPNAQFVLARLSIGEAKGNKSAPYIFLTASDADKTLARQFLAVKNL